MRIGISKALFSSLPHELPPTMKTPNARGEPPPPGTDARTGTRGRWGRSAPVRCSVGVESPALTTRPRSQGARRHPGPLARSAETARPASRRSTPPLLSTTLRRPPAARATERCASAAAGSGSEARADAGSSRLQAVVRLSGGTRSMRLTRALRPSASAPTSAPPSLQSRLK